MAQHRLLFYGSSCVIESVNAGIMSNRPYASHNAILLPRAYMSRSVSFKAKLGVMP